MLVRSLTKLSASTRKISLNNSVELRNSDHLGNGSKIHAAKNSTNNLPISKTVLPLKTYVKGEDSPMSPKSSSKFSELSIKMNMKQVSPKLTMKIIQKKPRSKFKSERQSKLIETSKMKALGLKYYYLSEEDMMMNKLRFKNIVPNQKVLSPVNIKTSMKSKYNSKVMKFSITNHK